MNGEIYSVAEIKKRLMPVFAAEPVYRAILFGSYARGEATEMSDVDIVVDSRGELRGLHFYGVLESIVEILDKDVDMIDLKNIKPGSPIFEDVMRGVILYER